MATVASVSPVAAMQALHTVGTGSGAKRRRRRISPETGRAIEMLGHAIEYLADEFALECRTRGLKEARKHSSVVAIELLMEKNREVYFSCPEIPTAMEKLREVLGFARA